MQNICGVKACEKYQTCPFGKPMVPKINVDHKFKLNLNEWPHCLMPPIIPNDPDDGKRQRLAA